MNKPMFYLSGIAAVVLTSVALTCCSHASPPVADAQYEAARQLVFQGRFEEAASGFEKFLREQPGHRFSSRATFMLGKSKMGRGDHHAAVKWFEKTIHEYPSSLEARKAKFKIAMIEFWRGNPDEARRRFQQIVDDADGPYTPEASAWLRYDERGMPNK